MTLGMPKFTMPPVVETLLAVQFEPLVKMRVTDYGLFWSKISEQFPIVQEHPPVPAVIESTLAQPIVINPMQWRIGGEFRLPRVWYRSSLSLAGGNGERGIQLQNDRFMQNWMRPEQAAERYPSYEVNRADFLKYLGLFAAFVKERDLGTIVPNQCEVTYVNRIPIAGGSNGVHGLFAECFPSLAARHSTDFLPETDRIGYMASFPIAGGKGRLHVQIQGPVRLETGAVVIDFRLTARGAPVGTASHPIMDWLDLGREWVVKGFYGLTSAKMHEKWGYKHD